MSSFGIAWQYFQPLGEGGELLVKHGVQGLDLVLLALVLVILPPRPRLSWSNGWRDWRTGR